MNDRANPGGAGVLIGAALIFLLLAGVAGLYLFRARGQMVARQAGQALLAADEARAQAERAGAAAADADSSGAAADDQGSSTDQGDSIRAAVESVLDAQEDAWNRGDIDVFVEHYWKSDDVTFSSGGKTTRGWAATLEGYRERYPTPEKMGRVKFSNLDITPLGDAAAMVLGEWNLERESEPLTGSFTLVFRKLDGRWVIIHDHTSRLIE